MGHAYCASGDFENAKKCYEKLRSLDKAGLADTYLQRLGTGADLDSCRFIEHTKVGKKITRN